MESLKIPWIPVKPHQNRIRTPWRSLTPPYGGSLKWGYANSWMAFNGKYQSKMDDLGTHGHGNPHIPAPELQWGWYKWGRRSLPASGMESVETLREMIWGKYWNILNYDATVENTCFIMFLFLVDKMFGICNGTCILERKWELNHASCAVVAKQCAGLCPSPFISWSLAIPVRIHILYSSLFLLTKLVVVEAILDYQLDTARKTETRVTLLQLRNNWQLSRHASGMENSLSSKPHRTCHEGNSSWHGILLPVCPRMGYPQKSS